MSTSCIFTIVSKNYISQARVLVKSFQQHYPDVKTFVLLADRVDGYFDPSQEPFEIVEAETIGIRDFPSFSFKYNIIEFNTAVKPFFFDYLFTKFGFRKIVYFDPDIVVFNDLSGIFESLDTHSIVLTPHILSPLPDDGCSPKDIDMLKVGIFNLGFIALSNTGNTKRFLAWWKERLYDKCLQAPLTGFAVDQIWVGLVPCFFADYCVLREPGYNVAYWNLHERSLVKEADRFSVNGTPLRFFHFSGFSLLKPNLISKFQDRHTLVDMPAVRELLESYASALIENGYHESVRWPYHYGFFKNGKKIPDLARSIYWGIGATAAMVGNPYEGFYGRLLRPKCLKALFTERFIRVMLDRLLLSAWRFMIKRRS